MNLDTSKRILVAEDNPNLRKVLISIVRKIGYTQIVEVDDGAKAWYHIEKGSVDLVLTDWAMPMLTGLELLQKVRAAPEPICNLPCLLITAADTRSAIMQAGRDGVDAYIIKPFSVATISEKIKEATQKRIAAGA